MDELPFHYEPGKFKVRGMDWTRLAFILPLNLWYKPTKKDREIAYKVNQYRQNGIGCRPTREERLIARHVILYRESDPNCIDNYLIDSRKK